ncbi:MAG: Tn3 family transposase [Pseudonocardiaceae bacterium]
MLLSLRDGLRSGDVFVPGSRRYADPTLFLLTEGQWAPRRAEYCQLVSKPPDASTAIAVATAELHTALADLDAQLAAGVPGQVRLNDDGELIIPPLTAEDVPTEAEALRDELAAMLPRVPLASVLVEIDARTGFTDHLTHAGGKVARPPELKRNLLYVIIAEATNMNLAEMAASAGISYDGPESSEGGEVRSVSRCWSLRDRFSTQRPSQHDRPLQVRHHGQASSRKVQCQPQ